MVRPCAKSRATASSGVGVMIVLMGKVYRHLAQSARKTKAYPAAMDLMVRVGGVPGPKTSPTGSPRSQFWHLGEYVSTRSGNRTPSLGAAFHVSEELLCEQPGGSESLPGPASFQL